MDAGWSARLTETGWRVVDERAWHLDLRPPHPSAVADYANGWFVRLAGRLTDQLEPDDRSALAILVDPHDPRSVLRRDDLHLRGTRTVTLGTRDPG
jgi:hypothetical protein